MKTCSRCKQEKPLEDFYARKGARDGRQGHCKKCHTEYVRNWQNSGEVYWKKPEVVERARAIKYGLTVTELRYLIEQANGLCAICSEPAKLAVDHDHATGNVRGMLCHRCNLRLGWVEQVGLENINNYLGL